MQVLQEHLKLRKKPKVQRKPETPLGVGSGIQSLLLPMELRLVLQGAVVKFEHHPLEVLAIVPAIPTLLLKAP